MSIVLRCMGCRDAFQKILLKLYYMKMLQKHSKILHTRTVHSDRDCKICSVLFKKCMISFLLVYTEYSKPSDLLHYLIQEILDGMDSHKYSFDRFSIHNHKSLTVLNLSPYRNEFYYGIELINRI